MMYVFDTYYANNSAHTVCVAFSHWQSNKETAIYSQTIPTVAAYESGAFYKRELPCILSLLEQIPLQPADVLVVDGYVTLNNSGKLGLGGYVYKKLQEQYAVVGIAKNEFSDPDANRIAVTRGNSKKPLFVTAMGASVATMAANVQAMHGQHRIPTLLKLVDQLSRKHVV